jgi:hypothetical protein
LNIWRTAVEAELGEPVSDHAWDELDERGYVEDMDLRLATPRQVAARVRQANAAFRAALDGRAARPSPREWDSLPRAGQATRARIDALSAIYAAQADDSYRVRQFRDTVLARTLSLMLADPAADWPTPAGPPVLSEAEVPGWVQWCFAADADDGDGNRHIRELVASTSPRGPRGVADLRYIAGREERALTVDARGALGRLALLAGDLSEEYRWRPSEAVMLVLTGRQPEVFVYLGSAEIRYGEANATSRVVMTVDPALTEEEVAGIYGRLRQRFRSGRPPRYQPVRRYRLAAHVGPHVQVRAGAPGSRPGPGRPPRPGPSGVAIFIEPVTGHSWENLRHTWNQLCDDAAVGTWRYESASNFIRDSKTALQRLLYPGWTSRP